MITVRFEVPVSANQRLIRTRGRQLTNGSKYRSWFARALHELKDQTDGFEQIKGRVGVSITVHFNDGRRRDLDNILKGFQDVCTHAGLWLDDSQIDHLTVVRGSVVEQPKRKKGQRLVRLPGLVEARIWEIGKD